MSQIGNHYLTKILITFINPLPIFHPRTPMDTHKLAVYCKVIEQKSFTRAAEILLLSQPTVSEHIRSLEEETGQLLLNRLGKEIRPTEAGTILYFYAVKALHLLEETRQALDQYAGMLSGRLRMGAGTIPGTYILPKEIGRFKKEHPNISISLRIAGSKTIGAEILSGELEMGVVGARWKEPGLSWQQLFQDDLIIAVPTTHPWAGKKEISLKQLLEVDFIIRDHSSGTRLVTEELLEKHGLNPAKRKIVAEIGSTEAIREAVKAGIGVAILSSRAVEEDIRSGALATVAINGIQIQRPFYLITRKKLSLSPLCKAFIESLT